VVWSMREARHRGLAVDEPVLAELTSWLAASGNGTTGVPRPAGIPKALNSPAVYYALALGADRPADAASQEALQRFWKTIKNDQGENGVWFSWPDTRPPIFGNSDQTMTALALLALLPAVAAGDESAIAARDKGLRWLSEMKTDDDPQSLATRL